jgi:hypothetical protein
MHSDASFFLLMHSSCKVPFCGQVVAECVKQGNLRVGERGRQTDFKYSGNVINGLHFLK